MFVFRLKIRKLEAQRPDSKVNAVRNLSQERTFFQNTSDNNHNECKCYIHCANLFFFHVIYRLKTLAGHGT